ncbi:hypothetical protein Tco_0200524 [Tanacetum coccineum]
MLFWKCHQSKRPRNAMALGDILLQGTPLRSGDQLHKKCGVMLSDVLFLKGDPLKIDQSALIGKSLPVTWEYMKCSLAGSTCKQGEVEVAVIVARVTLYGKVAHQKFVIATVVTLFRKVAHQTGEFEVVAIATVLTEEELSRVESVVLELLQKARDVKDLNGVPQDSNFMFKFSEHGRDDNYDHAVVQQVVKIIKAATGNLV